MWRRFAALGAVVGMLAGAAACTPSNALPRVAGGLEASTTVEPCERSLADAENAGGGSYYGANPRYVRYRLAARAAAAWRDVAVMCPGRFAQGVLTSGQMAHRAAKLAGLLGIAYNTGRTSVDEHTELHLTESQAAGMALAQDRAGFAMEILSARQRADAALLALSDRHKALGSGFAAHAADRDERQKVYSVQRLLADPVSIVDSANGLRASTAGLVEMDAVREQLEALAFPGGNGTEADEAHGFSAIIIADEATAVTLAALLSEETAQAFALGYPTYDAAVFAASGTDAASQAG